MNNRQARPPIPKQAKLVLLLDEIDELNGYSHRTNQRLRSLFMRGFADQLVAVIGRLRRALLAHDGLRTVLSSGPRLWDLAKESATSPFLDGFLPPLYLGRLKSETSCALVRQRHLAGDARPDLTDDNGNALWIALPLLRDWLVGESSARE